MPCFINRFVNSFVLPSSSDISRVRCITLACYVMKELEHYATQDGLTREQWFENVRPVPWANLPPYLWAMINDKFYDVFPPYLVLSFYSHNFCSCLIGTT
jgi:hypothetical protein